MAGSTIASVK